MTHRIRTLAALSMAAATLSASLLAAPSAHAEDQRPCVSMREYRGTDMNRAITRRELEQRWDVSGLGVRFAVDQWEYPACGYSTDEVVFGIVVEDRISMRVPSLDLRVFMVYRAQADVVTLHGHP